MHVKMKFDIENENLAMVLFNFVVDKRMEEWQMIHEVFDLSMAEYVYNFCLDEFRSYCEDVFGMEFAETAPDTISLKDQEER